jgi:hypothetical protein
LFYANIVAAHRKCRTKNFRSPDQYEIGSDFIQLTGWTGHFQSEPGEQTPLVGLNPAETLVMKSVLATAISAAAILAGASNLPAAELPGHPAKTTTTEKLQTAFIGRPVKCPIARKPRTGYAACVARCLSDGKVCDSGATNCSD